MDPVLLKVVHRVSGCTSGTKIGFGQCHLQSKWILVSVIWSHKCRIVLLLIAASGLCVTPLRLQPPHSNSYSTSYKRSRSISHGQTNVHTQRQKKRLGPQPPPPPRQGGEHVFLKSQVMIRRFFVQILVRERLVFQRLYFHSPR